jgi:hypothetical protein
MARTVLSGDVHVSGTLSSGDLSPPAGSIDNTAIQAGAAGNYVAATKLEHQFALPYTQDAGTPVAAATKDIHIVEGATGEVAWVKAAITGTIATGADRTVTVDLQKSTGAGAFATVLTTTIVLDNASVLRTAEEAVVKVDGSEDLVTGDILRVVITVAGAAGNQAGRGAGRQSG